MDYGLSEEQAIFQRSVRDFLQKECPPGLARAIEVNKEDYRRDVFKKMSDLGWLGLGILLEYGGVGGNWLDLAILYEEMGRALLPSPHLTCVLGGQAIQSFGTEKQKQRFLPMIARGELITALALFEPEAGTNFDLMSARAAPGDDGDFRISGVKLFVSYAHVADYVITVARTGNEPGEINGFLVKQGSGGLTCTPMETLSGERLCEITYENVPAERDSLLGCGEAITELMDRVQILSCSEMLGAAQKALEMSIDYSRQRRQFGVSISSFQAIQHKIANMAVALEGARLLVYYVAWLISEGKPCSKEIAMAKLQTSTACRFVTAEAVQIHGAVATMQAHDLGLYFRKVKAGQLNLGRSYAHKETIAQGLGL